jgi:hypothetical protein
MRRAGCWVAMAALLGAGLSGAKAEGEGSGTGGPDDAAAGAEVGRYPLDAIPRVLEHGQELPCGTAELVSYRGSRMRLGKPGRVHPAFVAKLEGLEAIIEATAREVYGRAPTRLVHLGTQACRRMRRFPDWVSEHALGNAIDLAGFDFGPLPRSERVPDGLPAGLRRAFSVRIDAHWNATRGVAAVHARFLRTLAARLIERPDLFRCVLGPAYPGHHDHLHLDFAPYRVVEVF